ncbi:hypothetical protein B7463_g4414, partial [Scytalidium lignicola]
MDPNSPESESAPPDDSADSSYAPSGPARTSCDLCKRMKEAVAVSSLTDYQRGNALLAVESRIKRLESVLTASGINSSPGESPAAEPEAPYDLSDRLSTLVIDEKGASHFLGASSGFSLFSPQGLQWISDRTGSDELSRFITTLTKTGIRPLSHGPSELWYTLSPSEREPLPSKHVAERLILSYFDMFNSCFPLFDREEFMELFERQYSGNPPQGTGWYACLNVVLCMGGLIEKFEIYQGLDPVFVGSTTSIDQSWQESNLMTVQALCGIAFVQQTILDPQPYLIVTAAAARLAHGMGLHRTLDEFGLSRKEIAQRRNVFWMVYLMDKSISLRIGHPSVITDNDIGVGLPPETDPDELDSNGLKKFNIFRYQAQLALVESRIYTELYSIRSRNRAISDRLRVVMYYALASFLTLFANTLQCPQDHNAESDIELMDIVSVTLAPAAAPPTPFRVAASIKLFLELRNIAAKFVRKVRSASPQPIKRSYDGYEMEQTDETPIPKDPATVSSSVPSPTIPQEMQTPDVKRRPR